MNNAFTRSAALLAMGFISVVAVTTPRAFAARAPTRASRELEALAKQINAAKSIAFTADYTRVSSDGKRSSYKVAGKLAKPNLIQMSVTPLLASGKAGARAIVSSDGVSFYASDSTSAKFIKTSATKEGVEPDSPEAMYFIYNVLGNSGQAGLAVAEALLPAGFDISAEKVPAGIKRTVITSSERVRLASNSELKIAQKVIGIRHTAIYDTVFDPRTNRLLRLDSYGVTKGAKHLQERIAFSRLSLSFTPPAREKFAYFPAGSMTEYHVPAGPGELAPEFSVARADGSLVHLADYKGKVVVIDFWATWCPPCLATLPSTDKLAAHYQGQDVVFLPICTWDSKSRFDAWLPKHSKWTMSWLFDRAGENQTKSIAETQYYIAAIPAQYVIGKDGIIVYRGFADTDAGEKPLVAAIQKAMTAS